MFYFKDGKFLEKASGASEETLEVKTAAPASFVGPVVDGAVVSAVAGKRIFIVGFTLSETAGAASTFRWRSNAQNESGTITLAALETKTFAPNQIPWANGAAGVSMDCNVGGGTVSVGARYIESTGP